MEHERHQQATEQLTLRKANYSGRGFGELKVVLTIKYAWHQNLAFPPKLLLWLEGEQRGFEGHRLAADRLNVDAEPSSQYLLSADAANEWVPNRVGREVCQ